MQATIIVITVMSYMPVTPVPMAVNIWDGSMAPVTTPTMRESTVPVISTTNTFTPRSAPISTTRYGMTR